jgi:hypothetical protein
MLSAVIPNARISWGYDANTHSTKRLSAMYLYDHAQKLVSDLCLFRQIDKVVQFIFNSLVHILKLTMTFADRYSAYHFHCA